MTHRGPRFLFQTSNRRGLGHLVRGLNLACAIQELRPDAESLFFARAAPPDGFVPPGTVVLVESDADRWRHDWPRLVESLRPSAVVYDTMLPDTAGLEPSWGGLRRIYVMRRSQPERQARVFASPALARMDLVLVPHRPEEFGYELPEAIRPQTVFVGPIVRGPVPGGRERMTAKYGLGPGTFLLVSTPGGGGFAEDAELFFDIASRVDRSLRDRLSDLRHVLVAGPRYPRTVCCAEPLTVVPHEPDLVDLFSLSDLVVAAGGYNTVNEIRIAGVPAMLVPGTRSHDDQHERVRRLGQAGLVCVAPQASPRRIAERIVELCLSDPRLGELRRNCAADRIEPGNIEAGRLMLSVVAGC